MLFARHFASGQNWVIPSHQYSAEALKEDLNFLQKKLENTHPNLYLYTEKSILDHTFDSLENGIRGPLTAIEFYSRITILSSRIKDGHTLILPNPALTDRPENVFLPYHVVILNQKLFIDRSYTNNSSLLVGAEITSINAIPANHVLDELMARQVRDGNNETYPTWVLSNYFRQYYSFVYGYPETFTLEYRIEDQTRSTTVKALSADSIAYYRKKNYPEKVLNPLPEDGIKLSSDPNNGYAVLTIRTFHNDVLKSEYKQQFKKAIDACFEQLSQQKTENLILDLRNNQGGDVENGVYLLAHLLDKPFCVVQAYYRLRNRHLVKCPGPSSGQHGPKSNIFAGNLYVLLNGGSFSNSVIVSACLQANNRATFIGQETGGNPTILAGNAKNLRLPNTGIQIQVPTKQYLLNDQGLNSGQGLVPKYIVEPELSDILNNRDTELEFALELIHKNQ